MSDQDKREKIINGMEEVIAEAVYPDRPRKFMMPLELAEDALALLKAQEPVKPYAMYSEHTGTKWLVCGACNEPMNKTKDETWANFCPNCGRAVKYDV